MTTLRARLGKLAPELTAKQRFLLVLAAYRSGQPQDRALVDAMPKAQAAEFNKYVYLDFVSEALLGQTVSLLAQHVQRLGDDLERAQCIDREADRLVREHPELQLAPGERLPRGHVTVPEGLHRLSRDLKQRMADDIVFHWAELCAVERVWEDMRPDFDGIDPANPTSRTQLKELKSRLPAMAGELPKRVRLRERDESKVAELQSFIRDVFEHLARIAPEPPRDERRAKR